MGGPHLPCQPAEAVGETGWGQRLEQEGAGAVYPPLQVGTEGKSEFYCTFHGVSVNL